MANIIVNGFNVGTELQALIIRNTTQGGSIPVEQLGHLLEFSAKQETTPLTSSPVIYNGTRFHRNIYHDFSGQLMFDRYNNNLTALVLRIMQNFKNSGAETYFSIYASIFNTAAGSEDELLYHNLVFDQHDCGKFGGTSKVEQSLAFRCQSLTITGQGG